jgi:hypothetical protein
MDGLLVIDARDPARPSRVGGFDTPWHSPVVTMGVAVAGGHACVAAGHAGLLVIDVRGPANPVRVGGYDTPGFAWGVAVEDGHAYVSDGQRGLRILRIDGPGDSAADALRPPPPRAAAHDAGGR